MENDPIRAAQFIQHYEDTDFTLYIVTTVEEAVQLISDTEFVVAYISRHTDQPTKAKNVITAINEAEEFQDELVMVFDHSTGAGVTRKKQPLETIECPYIKSPYPYCLDFDHER